MFHIPKISITTNIIRHSFRATNQANNGYSKSVLSHSFLKIKLIIKKTNRLTSFNVNDNLSTN